MYDTKRATGSLRRRVLGWYRRRGRDLPWRRTRDPYAVLVSEVMLQQTQVPRVLPAYARFLRRFPTLAALANAPLGEVLREWAGLGYNRRARDLHRIARSCVGGLPSGVDALDALPGIGRYTAGAVACFANGEAVAFADTNIRRVLGRALLGRTATEREAVNLDAALLHRADPASWHHALMDLGATLCVAGEPRCGECPLREGCRYPGGPEKVTRRRQSPFASSDRRVRGAILRVLRSGPQSIRALEGKVGDRRVHRLIAALVDEGLAERAGRVLRLPT